MGWAITATGVTPERVLVLLRILFPFHRSPVYHKGGYGYTPCLG